jgi:hypothetical protein
MQQAGEGEDLECTAQGFLIALNRGFIEQETGDAVFNGVGQPAVLRATGSEPKRWAYIWLKPQGS